MLSLFLYHQRSVMLLQEEIEQRTVTLIINTAKLTERELEKALTKLLAQMKAERQHKSVKEKHGKMTVKQLAEQNRGMQSIEVSDKNIGSFNRVARKYGIDFAPFKVKGENRYLIFFKGSDQDAMTAAFREYTDKAVKRKEKPSVLAALQKFKELAASLAPAKEKRRERER